MNFNLKLFQDFREYSYTTVRIFRTNAVCSRSISRGWYNRYSFSRSGSGEDGNSNSSARYTKIINYSRSGAKHGPAFSRSR